jgi:Flp pilus assembly protein TadD
LAQESETVAWAHIRAGRFVEAETVLRALVGSVDDEDHGRLCYLFGLLGSVLNSLGRHDDATSALREAMNNEQQVGSPDPEANPHRYFLANQYLNFGDAEQALATIQVVPPGVGHVRCYLHATAAKALRALGRQDEARRAAAEALAAAPNDEERSEVLSALGEMLESRH